MTFHKRFRLSMQCKGSSPLHGVPVGIFRRKKNENLLVISFVDRAHDKKTWSK